MSKKAPSNSKKYHSIWTDMADEINKSIKEIRAANSDYKAPTLVGELRDRAQSIVHQTGSKAGQVRSYKQAHSYLQETIGKSLGRPIKYSIKQYHDTLENLYKEQQAHFRTVRQYEMTEIDKIKNSLVNDLGASIEVDGNQISGAALWDYLDKFTLEELKDIFSEAVAKTDKTDGKMNYTSFAENLSEVIKSHLQ